MQKDGRTRISERLWFVSSARKFRDCIQDALAFLQFFIRLC